MIGLALFFLSAPRVQYRGKGIELDRHKSLALLAYLSITEQPHRRDSLAALLWPELDQRRARAGLRRVLWSLQSTLPGEWWDVERESIGLRADCDLQVDVTHFLQLLADCRHHGHSLSDVCPDCLAPLAEAAEIYHGDLLAGFSLRDCPAFDDWQFARAEYLRRELAGALERLVRWHSEHGQFEPAIAYARRWVALDALVEPAQQQLMRLYARADQRAAALRQFSECARLLEAELGVAPQAATLQLYQAIKDNRLPPIEAPAHAGESRQTTPTRLPQKISPPVSTTAQPAPAAATLDRIGRADMIGREQEWPQAAAAWERANSGETRVLLVSGEPGVGKTRLVHELSSLAQSTGGRVLAGECYAEGGAPYSPLAHTIRQALETAAAASDLPDYILADLLALAPQLLPQFAHIPRNPSLDADFERERLYDSFADWCRALTQQSPLLLVVEDVHWADSGTLAVLRHLARRVRQGRLLLVLTYRDTESDIGQAHALNQLLLDLNRERLAQALRLARLGRESTGSLLGALLGAGEISVDFVDSIFRDTEGNPYFIEEVCRTLIEDGKLYFAGGYWRRGDMARVVIPKSVRAAILSRVAKLPGPVQEILQLAAVIGRRFNFEILTAASPHDNEALIGALERARSAQLITDERQAGQLWFTFAHALIPFTLRESLSGLRLQRLHGLAAAAIEARQPDDLEALAYHFAASDERPKAIDYARRAAGRAIALYDYDTALMHLRTALDLLRIEHPSHDDPALLEHIADVQRRRGERAEAMQGYAAALAAGRQLASQDKWAAVRLHRKVSETYQQMTSQTELQPFTAATRAGLESALSLVAGEPPHLETVRLLVAMANSDYWNVALGLSARRDMDRFVQQAIDMAEKLDSPVELSAALGVLDISYGARGLFRERVDLARRRLGLIHDTRFTDGLERLSVLCQTGIALRVVGEFSQALPHLREAERLAAEARDVSQLVTALELQAQCLFGLDCWEEMLQIDTRQKMIVAEYGSDRVDRMCMYCGISANVLGWMGELEAARARRQEAYDRMVEYWLGPPNTWPAVGHY